MAHSSEWCDRHGQPKAVCSREGFHGCVSPPSDAMPAGLVPPPMDQASIEFRTIYESLRAQGFSESHSIYLVAAQITGNPGIAPGENLPDPPSV